MGQTRERPSNKAERRKAAEASRAPIVRCKSSVAGTSVFAIEDLTRLIFLQTPEGVLLSKFQRVCRQWQKLAQEVLQPFLDGMPTSSPKMKFQDRQMNPLLREHFGRIFDDGKMQLNIGLWLTGQHFSRMRSLIDLPMATSGPGRVVHEAYARAGASWRNMQIYHPPIYEIKYRREGEDALEITETARGIRFGDVYDVLVAITSNTKGFSWSEALLNWPQIGPNDDTESRSNDDDSDDEPASRDCIYIERRQHDLPKFCECARAPSDNERCFCGFGGNKHKLQLIASNKWRVTSKEYNEKDLIGQPCRAVESQPPATGDKAQASAATRHPFLPNWDSQPSRVTASACQLANGRKPDRLAAVTQQTPNKQNFFVSILRDPFFPFNYSISMPRVSFKPPRPWSSQVPDDNLSDFGRDSDSTMRNRSDQDLISPNTPSPQSLSPQPTLTRRNIPPPSPLTSSPDLYGPDRSHIFTRLLSRRSTLPERSSPRVRFDETQLPMLSAMAGPAPMAGLKDELAIAAGKVTPGVDDTPYIQYALSALTRDRTRSSQDQPHYSPQSASAYFDHLRRTKTAGEAPSSRLPVPVPEAAYTQNDAPMRRMSSHREPPAPLAPTALAANDSPVVSIPIGDAWDVKDPSSTHWVAVTEDMRQSLDPHGRTYPPLTYKPSILRPFSMMILMTLCLCMMAALIFCVQYSSHHQGLTPYPGSIYTAQFFVFRVLPQLLGAFILIYAQSIVNTSLRVLPFVKLADEDPQERYLAMFAELYPKSLLHPQFVGPWQIMLFDFATWLALFTVPLLSASFTCIYKSDRWVWAAVPVVIWILVALYSLLVISTAIVMVFWFGKWTGFAWDIRSIGDLLPLLNRSNAIPSFDPHNLTGSRDDFQTDLRDRWFDRLGYWRSGDMITGGIWYSIGAVGARGNDAKMVAGLRRDSAPKVSMDSEATAAPGNWRRVYDRYLPTCIQSLPLIIYTVVCTLLLVALLIVSFMPQTRIDNGFRPLLAARPGNDAFSGANFLYSFLPSVIGMLFWMFFQPVDMAFRRLQPWADMGQLDGATASKSILADYAACLPLQSSWRAARNGHWRVALLSFMAQAFVAIPVLGGGLFVALAREDRQVRMYPSMPVFGVLVAFLILYVGCLCVAIPGRSLFELPRPVTSIAAIMSLCSARELTQDSAFRSVRSREDLEGRLGVGRDPREETTWFYGVVAGRDEHRVSVRRMQRYTEKPRLRTIEAMV